MEEGLCRMGLSDIFRPLFLRTEILPVVPQDEDGTLRAQAERAPNFRRTEDTYRLERSPHIKYGL